MKRNTTLRLLFAGILMVALSSAAPAWPQTLPTPPDLTVCDDITCQTLFDSICSLGGFKITLTYYEPASGSEEGTIFQYEICDAHLTECPVTGEFYELSHFDVTFPEIGGPNSCLPDGTDVIGYCECENELSFGCSVNPDAIIGDGSCFTESSPVAKCEINELQPGECIVMTLVIIGETPGLVPGPAVVVDKAGDNCTASCIVGPACEPCQDAPPNGEACLTRTHGFWGTHPHIAELFDPVIVCGVAVDGQNAGECSTSEALCSNAKDNKDNPAYLSLVTQLTAAQLNLNATKFLLGGECSTWRYEDKSIQEWINYCEGKCSANKQDIGRSGCIGALTAFNESQETRFDVLPYPFDKPGPANPRQCQDARGNGKYIGLQGGGLGCPPAP